MSIVDASVFVGLLRTDDPHHAKANEAAASGPLMTTRGTLSEVANHFRRVAKASNKDGGLVARAVVDALVRLPGFREAPQVDLEHVLALHRRHRRLSFDDAWVLAVAVTTREPLVTFDDDLAAAWRKEMTA